MKVATITKQQPEAEVPEPVQETEPKITLGDLVRSRDALLKLLSFPLPVKTSYWLGRLAKTAESELNHFDSARQKLMKKYGGKDDGNGIWSVPREPRENFDAYVEDVDTLLKIEVDLKFKPIDISQLGEAALSGIEMMMLEPFLKMDTEAKSE